MMRRILFSLLIVLSSVSAIDAQVNLSSANKAYSQGNYTLAAQQYEAILSKEGVAPEIYYNLGNAYYKLNEVGKAILNYERALRLDPSFDDAKINLELTQLKVVDNVSQNNSFFISKWIGGLMKSFSSNSWFAISIVLFLICLGGVLMFVFGSSIVIRKSSFYLAIIAFVFTLISGVFASINAHQFTHHNSAIIMAGTVTVKSSPDKSGTDLFQLHEGTKVTVKSTLGSWIEISLNNGSVGWVEQNTLEKI